jgi:hypothetical protein
MEEKGNPYDMNSSSFDAEKYLQNLTKVRLIFLINQPQNLNFPFFSH